jgi:hypothetical protein
MQKIYPTEAEAREAARKLGGVRVQIVESKREGYRDTGPWVFYLETDEGSRYSSFVRAWERLVYSGRGAGA